MTTADTFFDEATPPPDMEWTPPRLQLEVDPVSSSPWFIGMAAVAIGVILRLLMLVEVLEPPDLLFGLGWAISLGGCALATVLLARNREALTGRHIADVALLGFATGAFTWLFPHDRGVELIDLSDRIGMVAMNASAGWLVGAIISLALARARTSISRVSLLLADGITLFGALFLRGPRFGTVGLALLLAAWAFAIAGWNERIRFAPNQGPPSALRSPRSMVSFATALTAASAIVESFTKGLWADEIPILLLLGLLFIAAVVSVVDARRQTAAAAGSADKWSEWRSSVETGTLGEPTVEHVGPATASDRQPAFAGADLPVRESPFSRPAVAPIVPDAADEQTPAATAGEVGAAPSNLWLSGASGSETTASVDLPDTGADAGAFIAAPASTSAAEVITPHTSSLPFRTRTELQTFPAASAWTDDGEFLGANAEFWELCGTPAGEAFNLLAIVHPEDRPAFALNLARGTRTNLPFRTTVRLQGASGVSDGYRLDVAAGPYQADSSPLGDVADATYQVSLDGPIADAADSQPVTTAMFDPLTGLGNADYLEHWITARAEHVRRRTDRPLLVILELATLGHYEQSEPRLRDLIQTEVAFALHSVCRDGDFVVRLDGPYFAAVIEGVLEGDEWYVLNRFEEIVKGTVSIAGRTYKVDGRLLPLRPNPGATLTDILDQVAALLVAPADLVPSVQPQSEASPDERRPGPGQQVMLGVVGTAAPAAIASANEAGDFAAANENESSDAEPSWGAGNDDPARTSTKPVLRAVPEPEDGIESLTPSSTDDTTGEADDETADDTAATPAQGFAAHPFALSGHVRPPVTPLVITPPGAPLSTPEAADSDHEPADDDAADSDPVDEPTLGDETATNDEPGEDPSPADGPVAVKTKDDAGPEDESDAAAEAAGSEEEAVADDASGDTDDQVLDSPAALDGKGA